MQIVLSHNTSPSIWRQARRAQHGVASGLVQHCRLLRDLALHCALTCTVVRYCSADEATARAAPGEALGQKLAGAGGRVLQHLRTLQSKQTNITGLEGAASPQYTCSKQAFSTPQV